MLCYSAPSRACPHTLVNLHRASHIEVQNSHHPSRKSGVHVHGLHKGASQLKKHFFMRRPRRGAHGSLHLLVELNDAKQIRRAVRLDASRDGTIVLVDATPQRLGHKRERRFSIAADALISAIEVNGVLLNREKRCSVCCPASSRDNSHRAARTTQVAIAANATPGLVAEQRACCFARRRIRLRP